MDLVEFKKIAFSGAISIALLLLLPFFNTPGRVHAQCSPPPTCQTVSDCNRNECLGCSWCTGGSQPNSYSCAWDFPNGPCRPVPSCNQGFGPGSSCDSITNATTCAEAGNFSCVAISQLDCFLQFGGQCVKIAHNVCPDSYNPTPVGGYGELGCGTAQACCTQATSGCIPTGLLGCPAGYDQCPNAPRCCTNLNNCPVFDPGWAGGFSFGGFTPALCPDNEEGIDTAIGCIPVSNTQEFLAFLLGWALGIAGGIALILIVYAGFLIITSAGNPQRVQAGKELLTAAIMGLALVLFSAFILQFIGVTILDIPGFGT